MNLLVTEFVCGGFADEFPRSALRREGLAMLRAIVADFQNIPECRVTTLWDEGAGSCPIEGADIRFAAGPDDAERMFRQLAAACDATFDIAPELDGALLQRRRVVAEAGGIYLGPAAAAIALCSDKLQLASHLAAHGVATIPTRKLGESSCSDGLTFPAVIKRRDGAGSISIETVADRQEFECARQIRAVEGHLEQWIVQPLMRGQHLSTATLVCGDTGAIDVFPVGEQRLGGDGRFGYRGGRIPAPAEVQPAVMQLARETCAVIPGLAGYVGFDVLLPDVRPLRPVVVEINPRLTTAYLGYRALTDDNIVERIAFSDRSVRPICWKQGTVEFDADGRTSFTERVAAGRAEFLR